LKQTFKTKQFRRILSYFLLAIAVIVSYKIIFEIGVVFNFIKRFVSIISPFISGFLIAYVLNIPCSGIQKLLAKSNNTFISKRRKTLSILITYFLLFLVLFLILNMVIPSIYRSIYLFIANFQTYYYSANHYINYLNDLNILNIDISMDKIMSAMRDFGLGKLPSSINALFGVSSLLFSGFLALISSVYILIEKEKFKKYLSRMLKAFFSDRIYHFMLKYTCNLNKNFKQYIYTQTIDGCILGTIVTIELFLLGSPYALILGIMLGIVNYIPYFGSIFGSIIAVIIVAFTQNIPTAVLTAVILLTTQQIDGNIIQPRLMSGSFSLSPLLVIISITIGGAFSGILGMIVAIPIVAVMKDILEEIIVYYEQQKQAGADES